jgi:hypothetical protein
MMAAALAHPASAQADTQRTDPGLTSRQRGVLSSIARDTWAFFSADIDPNTHLPLDNLGPGRTQGDLAHRR